MKNKKMVIYGEPGTGKSVFAAGTPNPFFICTDGNYEWLLDFGAKWENHVQVFSWAQIKKVLSSEELNKYDTIVIDLLEDAYKWCEQEVCIKNGWAHVNDPGYGKGYDMVNNEFFIEISKLLNLDKNIILIMHGETQVTKDKRGIEHSKFVPSSRIRAKCVDMIEGRVRYFLRAYAVSETDADENLVTNRYLSLSPDGSTEFGIMRGISKPIPRDIPLDWTTFSEVVENASGPAEVKKSPTPFNFDDVPLVMPTLITKPATKPTRAAVKVETKAETKVEPLNIKTKLPSTATSTSSKETEPVVEETKIVEKENGTIALDLNVEETPKADAKPKTTKADDIAAIKAKLAAMKAAKNNN